MSSSFKLPEDVIDQLDLLKGLIECRDRAVRYSFFARRAVYYARRAEKLQRRIWACINELFPETRNGHWSILADIGYVRPADDEVNIFSSTDDVVH